jgi:hypothetical protein
MYRFSAVPSQLFPLLPVPHSLLYLLTPIFFTYLKDQPFLLVARIPIHSCPWFAINCSPLAASPTSRHPTDHVTYLHRQHQHQLSRLIHLLFSSSLCLSSILMFLLSMSSLCLPLYFFPSAFPFIFPLTLIRADGGIYDFQNFEQV